MNKKSKYLTVNQIAAYLEVSKQAVNNWIKVGDMKVYRLPSGRIKILKSDFLSYLETNNLYVDSTFFGNNLKNIVVIDDDVKILDLYRQFFDQKMLKVNVEYATDGISGLIKVGTLKADMVILDIELAGMNGIQVCNKILEDKSLGEVKIVIVSGFIKNFNHILERMTIETQIEKPFTISLLEEKLLPHRLLFKWFP